ncbi:MAG: DUF3761 domain-containing protein [Gemmatimonadaceae bacterium]
MRISALIAVTSLCLATHSLVGQEKTSQGAAVTRVATPLREGPSVESAAFATIPPKTSVNVSSCTDGWCAVEYQNRTGHVIQVFLRFAPLAAPQTLKSAPPSGRGYTNSQGEWVQSPTRTLTGQAPAGASAKCRDDTYSFSRSRRGTCSHHGGVALWL